MKALSRICFVLLAVLTLAACKDDGFVESVVEGKPVTLRLSIAVPEAGAVAIKRATDAQETSVEKVALLFYRVSFPDNPPVVIEITDMGNPEKLSETHYKYTVTIPEYSGLCSGNWYLYAVANYDKQFVSVTLDQLKTMTKAEVDNFCTGGSAELDIVETAILMSGKYEGVDKDGTLTLQPGENVLTGDPTLKLRRLISKSTFVFENGTGVTFTPTSYDLVNYSTSSTLMERSGWEGEKGTKPGSLGPIDNEALSTKTDIPIEGMSFSFYTQENVQVLNVGFTDYNNREKRVSDTDRTFKYAPQNATYVVVKGRYEGPGEKDANGNSSTTVTGDVEYTIHLGDFSDFGSQDNFTVRRNVHYTYKVTVNGVNNIIVEATTKNENQSGAEGDIMKKNDAVNVQLDAHYEQVLLAMTIPNNTQSFTLSIKTPYTNKIYTSIDDLTSDADYGWVEFGKPVSASSFNSYGTLKKAGKLCNIKELLNMLKNPSANTDYLLVSGDKVYVTAYVNEYYYDNKDLSTFVNADDREMILSNVISISPDGHSTYTETPIFALKQRSIKSPFNLSMNNPFGIETVEETQRTKAGLENEGSIIHNSKSYGWKNFKNLIGADQNWSTYINEANNGYINGVIDESKIMQSAYNKPQYQCLSRNRDNNGNGVIDDDEIRWFLPAHDQCVYLWYGHNSLPLEAKLDVTSRNDKTYMTSTDGNMRTWWVDEGVAFGQYKNLQWTEDNVTLNEHTQAVRAIRALNDPDGETSQLTTYTGKDNGNIVLVSGLSSDCLRQGMMVGNYDAHKRGHMLTACQEH